MVASAIPIKRKIKSRPKVKTGCSTCRIRKVKCDENKPSCQRCVSTGRTCDGYESRFRIVSSHVTRHVYANNIVSDLSSRQHQLALDKFTSEDIELLNRDFSIKTIFNVRLGCVEEARQVLQASMTDPPIRHAILSLRALRKDLETSGDGQTSVAQQSPSHQYGLQQYGLALGGLVSNLSFPSYNAMKSALLCCQIFISIEQLRKNYAAMAQHIVRGLKIMHEYRARPSLVDSNKLVPAHHDKLPFLDVFIIKLFAAPCKFADLPRPPSDMGPTSSACLASPQQMTTQPSGLRTIVPDMRAELERIAALTLTFLSKVSQIKSVGVGLELLSEKAALLDSLHSWFNDLERNQKDVRPPKIELVSVSFLRTFHSILRIVLLGTLDSSRDLDAELEFENHRLQELANHIGEQVKSYQLCSGVNRVHGEQASISCYS